MNLNDERGDWLRIQRQRYWSYLALNAVMEHLTAAMMPLNTVVPDAWLREGLKAHRHAERDVRQAMLMATSSVGTPQGSSQDTDVIGMVTALIDVAQGILDDERYSEHRLAAWSSLRDAKELLAPELTPVTDYASHAAAEASDG